MHMNEPEKTSAKKVMCGVCGCEYLNSTDEFE